jgi:hypothetical protein
MNTLYFKLVRHEYEQDMTPYEPSLRRLADQIEDKVAKLADKLRPDLSKMSPLEGLKHLQFTPMK